MNILALVMTFAMALIGVGGLELALTYERGSMQRTAGNLADQYMTQAEQDYVTQLTPYVQQGMIAAQFPTIRATNQSLCTSGCNMLADYTVTSISNSSGPAGATWSSNVNANANERRIAATLTMTVKNGKGMALATRVRTFIVRTYNTAPWASIVASSDSQDPYQAVGTQHANLAEGDASGCSDALTCGKNTQINSYAACNYGSTGNASLDTMQQKWCKSLGSLNATNAGSYQAGGNASPTQRWVPISTTTNGTTNAQWTDGNAASGSHN